ncbi:uncharacterized protein [Dermacentor andersoni]|uniref:uncharacterized protein isoform X2 n=1 Tax=Dermacentor andersoni TaxID=34620 RepID=UPI002416BE1F|nr:uncharacterized protein LOC126543558 isoform X2 [Dermacentor andersoni]
MTATRGLVLRQFIILMAVGTLTESTPTSEPHPIGVGVTVEARIFFDKTINFSATNENRPFEEFKKIFLENDSFSVPFVNMTKAVDGEKTLENVKAFGMARSAPNNTIFYYFTSYTILKESGQKHENDQVPVQLFDIETRRTFCSENVSAAVVYFETATSYDFPARAAALIFGSTRYTSFQRTDRQYMNESFSRCGKHTVTST